MLALQRVSGFFFYLLGTVFVAAYVLLKSDAYGSLAALWMDRADLPFIASALTYGGISLYRNMRPNGGSPILAWGIAIVCSAIFVLTLVLNFWR